VAGIAERGAVARFLLIDDDHPPALARQLQRAGDADDAGAHYGDVWHDVIGHVLGFPLTVEQAPQQQWVAVLQGRRQQAIREILVAHRPQESQDRGGAHRGGA